MATIKARDELTIGKVSDGGKITEVVYQAGASGVTAPTGNWSSKVVATSADKPYLWTRSKYEYIDSSGASKYEYAYTVGGTIEGVQVGGRNLVKGSATWKFNGGTVGFVGTYSVVDDSDALSKKHIEIKCTTAGVGFYSTPLTDGQMTGKVITFGFWAKCSTNRTIDEVGFEGTDIDGCIKMPLTTEWQYFSHTFTGNSKKHAAFIFYYGWRVNDILYIRDFKVEYGNKATDWTPAPEDVDGAISTAQKTADTATNKVNALEKKVDVNLIPNPDNLTASTWIKASSNVFLAKNDEGYFGINSVGGGLYCEVTVEKNTDYYFTFSLGSTWYDLTIVGKDSKENLVEYKNTRDNRLTNKTLVYNFNSGSNTTVQVWFQKNATGSWFYIKNPKLIKGVHSSNYVTMNDEGIMVSENNNSYYPGKNVLIDSDSVDIRDGSTVLSSFGSTTTIGKSTGRNVYIDSDSVDIRNGATVLASYGSNIKLGSGNVVTYVGSSGLSVYDAVNNVDIFEFTKNGIEFYNDPTSKGNTYYSYFNKNGIKLYAPSTSHPEFFLGNDSANIQMKYDSDEEVYKLQGYSDVLCTGSLYPDSINMGPSNTISVRYLKSPSGYGFVFTSASLYQFYINSNKIVQMGIYSIGRYADLYMNLNMQKYSISNTSDKRLKKDFEELDDKWGIFFDSLKPTTFNYKDMPEGRHIGFIAQDIKEALDAADLTNTDFSGLSELRYSKPNGDSEVTDLEDGDTVYGLAYTEFIALNTHEIQKLKKENTELKDKVATLESRIEALEKLLSNL